jgi:hypothetical protein
MKGLMRSSEPFALPYFIGVGPPHCQGSEPYGQKNENQCPPTHEDGRRIRKL